MANLLSISFDFNYLPLLIIVSIAWGIPMLMKLLHISTKVPTIIVEILAGFVAGHLFFDSFGPEAMQILDFLGLTGFIFLMFLSGLEIDVDQIIASLPRKKLSTSRYLKNPLLIGLTFFIITLILSYAGAIAISGFIEIKSSWYFALILITSSVGIILPVLKDRGESGSRFGQMIIQSAAIADIISIILFTFTAFIIEKGGFKIELLLVLLLFIAFYLFYRIGYYLSRISLFKKLTFQLSHAASQISVRGTIFILLMFIVLAQYIGEEVILLGAFLAGILLSMFLHKGRSILIMKLDGMGFGFFIPIFFFMVGANFDPAALMEFDNSLFGLLIMMLIVLYAVKMIPSLLWVRLFGIKKALSGGVIMASRLSLIIAASTIGLKLDIISPGINACFIILAVATCFLSPVIFNFIYPKSQFAGDKTIIIGGSSTGILLKRRLKMHGKESVIIEKDKVRYQEMKSKGIKTYLGDGSDPELFEKIKLNANNYVVVLTGSNEENLKICKNLRKEYNHERIISKSGSSELDKKFQELEVESLDVIQVLASTIESLILRPSTYHALVETFENFSVEEFKIINKNIAGKMVKEIPFHEDGTLILVKKGEDMHIPHGDTYLSVGDEVTILGTDAALNAIREQISS